jgi:hypothetical protein
MMKLAPVYVVVMLALAGLAVAQGVWVDPTVPPLTYGPPGPGPGTQPCATCGLAPVNGDMPHPTCPRCAERPYCPGAFAFCGYGGVCEDCRGHHLATVPHNYCRDHGLTCGYVTAWWFGIPIWHCSAAGCDRTRWGNGVVYPDWGDPI